MANDGRNANAPVNANVHLRGWWDTNPHINAILKADQFLSKLVFRHLGVATLEEASTDIVTAAVTIFSNARYLAHGLPVKSKEYVASLVIGEMMAPVLPTRLTLPQIQARSEFTIVVTYLLTEQTVYNRGRTYVEWVTELNEANEALEENQQVEIPRRDNMSMADLMDYLIWLAIKLPATQYMSPVALVVTSYIGVAKRGTMSDRYISKVVDGVREDLGVTIILDTDTVRAAYVNFGRYVTADNAQGVFERWIQAIPEHALRLRLCLEQVAGSGLTAFIIVGEPHQRKAHAARS